MNAVELYRLNFRDQAAKKCMAAILSNGTRDGLQLDLQKAAKQAFDAAEALLTERDKRFGKETPITPEP
jgi:hypothetical protein